MTAPTTKTGTILTLNDSGPADPNRIASGKLTNATGAPLAGVLVSVACAPANGAPSAYQLSGLAPASAVQGAVGFRINTDYPAAWPSFWFVGPMASNICISVQLRRVRQCRQPFHEQQLLCRGAGLDAAGTIRNCPQRSRKRQMVQVAATTSQSAMLDSSPFPVTAGASLQVAISARVPPTSAGSGYFFLAFKDASGNFVPIQGPNPSDLKAQTIPFTAMPLAVGTATTDVSGNFSLSLAALGSQQVFLQGTYAGCATLARIRPSVSVMVPGDR